MHQEIWFQKYKILDLLGRGGTAKVYLAEHIKLNSYRAIKVISKNHPLYQLQRNEAFILKNLKHSCIPIIYDIEEDEEGSYIVEQYLEGETLKDYVEMKGAVPEDSIISFGLQICDLIHYLHSIPRPLLYVDLKPENIILSGGTLKLVDFGSAIYRDELSDSHEYSATMGYAAPELYRKNIIDERCDVYGIGILLYYLATGYAIKNDREEIDHIDLAGNCSGRLKNIINKCLKYNPSQRYASVARLSKELSAFIRKNQIQGETFQTLQIAVAGAQQRIGVTHFAFRLCNYFRKKKRLCLYQERNDSGCVSFIKSCYVDVAVKEGIFEVEGIPIRSHQPVWQQEDTEYRTVVVDYGCLSKENLTDFLSSDVKLLILGAKDWELGFSERVLNMVAEYKDISYLFNFMDGRQFQQVMKSMNHKNSYRIPYEPDPFAAITANNGLELFDELFQITSKRSLKERAVMLLRKVKIHETQTDAFF